MDSEKEEIENRKKLFEKSINDMVSATNKGLDAIEKLSILMILFILCIGVLTSMTQTDWGFLARMGSIIVIWGILIAYSDFSNTLSN